jgi:hypothetical protein
MAKSLFTTPKNVKAGRVLVTSAQPGTIFRPPAGQSKAAARKTLWD